jgi:cytochrome P450
MKSADKAAISFPLQRADPFFLPETYAALRARSPIVRARLWDGSEAWLALSYDAVRVILKDSRFSVEAKNPGYPFVTETRKAALLTEKPNLSNTDPPDHDRFRRMLTPMFTAKRIAEMAPLVESLVDELVDAMEQKGGPLDFVSEFSWMLPIMVLEKLVGVPADRREIFVRAVGTRFDLTAPIEQTARDSAALTQMVEDLVIAREANPGTGIDVMSRLVRERVLTGELAREDAVMMLQQLLIAGFDTTAHMISMGTLILLENPGELAKLKVDASKVPNAVNELLRYVTVLQFFTARTATEDVEIEGTTIRKGEGVLTFLAAANRDPDQFPDPDRVDVERPEANQHLAFSFGVHHCVGQFVARLEMETAFSMLVRRLPRLRLALPLQDMGFTYDGLSFGPTHMLVEW